MRAERGFTLLEVLVAFIIAALALGVLYRGALDGILSARVAAQYDDATSRAKSRLAVIGHGSAIVPGEQTGDDGGGFRFRTRIATAAAAPRPPGPRQPGTNLPTLYAVTVQILWGEGQEARQVLLSTQRTGFAAPAGP